MVSDHLVQRTLQELKQRVLSDAHKIQHACEMAQGDLPVLSHVAAMQELIGARSPSRPGPDRAMAEGLWARRDQI